MQSLTRAHTGYFTKKKAMISNGGLTATQGVYCIVQEMRREAYRRHRLRESEKKQVPQHETIQTPPVTCNTNRCIIEIQETSKHQEKVDFPGSNNQLQPSAIPCRDREV